MLDIERILKEERLIRAMTGLNSQAFNALLPSFTEASEKSLIKPEIKRKRAMGGGRKATLREMKDKLFYILLYCKCYPTFDLMSVLFNFDRSCAHQWVHRLLPILEVSLGDKKALPVRQLTSRKEFVEKFPFVKKVILDGTERPVQRPPDNEKQKEYYSGKKKRHTRKHITGSTDEKRVIYLSKGRGGKAHDKKQLDEENLG
ncbi:transposase family protein, partial [Microcystis sp. M109S1]